MSNVLGGQLEVPDVEVFSYSRFGHRFGNDNQLSLESVSAKKVDIKRTRDKLHC